MTYFYSGWKKLVCLMIKIYQCLFLFSKMKKHRGKGKKEPRALCWPTSKSDEDEERQNVLGESGVRGCGGALCRWARFHVCYEKGFLHEGDIIGGTTVHNFLMIIFRPAIY